MKEDMEQWDLGFFVFLNWQEDLQKMVMNTNVVLGALSVNPFICSFC